MKKLTIIGVLLVSSLGTLFHFLYDYLPLVIFPKNESIFEHMKLIIFPMLFYFFGSVWFVKENKERYFASGVTAMFIAMFITITAYYTYSGFLGFNVDFVNIIIFLLAIVISFIFVYKKKTLFSFNNSIISLIIVIFLAILFSLYVPELSFFRG